MDAGNAPLPCAASSLVTSDSVPGSEEAEICLEEAGGTIPKYGREYDLRNTRSNGREESDGSLDNYCISYEPAAPTIEPDSDIPGLLWLS